MKSTSSSLSTKSAGAGVLAAVVASLCCITPVLAFTAGISGIAATFSWIEPFRPFLVVMTVSVLGFAWYQKLKPRTQEELECACEENNKPSFWQTRRFLGIVTVFAGLMLSFPSYSSIFYPDSTKDKDQTTNTLAVASFLVDGMICSGCEEHLKHATGKLGGVVTTAASFEKRSVDVVFDASMTDLVSIQKAIDETGYSVTDSKVRPYQSGAIFSGEGEITFYSVPLVCNAASSLGCGSRSRPVLATLDAQDIIMTSWLDRSGKYIALQWSEAVTDTQKKEVVKRLSEKHQIQIVEVAASEALGLRASLASGIGWYSGDEVFELSKEEAGIIADRIILSIKEMDGNRLNFADEARFRSEIQQVFYRWFVNYENVAELSDLAEYKTRIMEIQKLGEKYSGIVRMPEVNSLLDACSGQCNHQACDGSSCKIGLTGSLTIANEEPFSASKGYQLVEFSVEGMTCGGCENHLMSELVQLTGVDKVSASYKDEKARISYDESRITREELIQAINRTGYKVVEKK